MGVKLCNGAKVGVFHHLCDMPAGDPAVVAKQAEDLGFDSYWVPEHGVIPKGSADIYPGKQPDEPPPRYLFEMPDPMIALARASATTQNIKLGTGVALVPEKPPLNAALEIASIDHYSGGRFLYGIGAGWNEPECTALGGDFDHRWTQTTEAIEVMKKVWTGEYVEHHGKYFDFPPLVCLPAPATKPHPPVLLGSIGTPRVFKRVAKWGDGWMPFTANPDDISEGKIEITKHAKEFGRDPESFQIILFATPDGAMSTAPEIAEAAKAGADSVVVWILSEDATDVSEELKQLASRIF